MTRGSIPDDDDTVARKGKVVTTTEGWPELLRCTTTKPPPILLDELIEEILLRIPASSLVRLGNSVCSSWRTLISSSRFAKDHLRRSMAVDPALTHPRIAYYSTNYPYPTIGIFSVRSVLENPLHEPTKVVAYEGRRWRSIIGSCNGLLCLHDGELGDRAILWNPCTGFTSQPRKIGGLFNYYGFGYDHVNDKYKLFGSAIKRSGESVTRIFTFGPKSKRRTIQDFPYRLPDKRASVGGSVGLFVSGTGTLNWLLLDCSGSFVAVLSLDLVKETYSQFSAPKRKSGDAFPVFPHLSILRGCLAVCYETKKTHWTLWLMKDYGVPQSWTKLPIIPHHPLLVNPRTNPELQPLYMLENNVLLAKSPSCKLVLCNLNDGSINFPIIDSSSDGMTKHRPLSWGSYSRIFYIYHESLVSPSHFGLPGCSSEMRLFKPAL
ncbi:F-box/kelch-repeat protein At3g23880-like [Arachis stenosperma]|uniref:F-box/kelch-repeat protein At3g23880-like n=1 Tax=Arachis stenosperma TaxID=217475 RepID=UPI0025ABB5C0|nr:F-box/kelch-repeat protein At3g23880-like [Arachis stenosperma]